MSPVFFISLKFSLSFFFIVCYFFFVACALFFFSVIFLFMVSKPISMETKLYELLMVKMVRINLIKISLVKMVKIILVKQKRQKQLAAHLSSLWTTKSYSYCVWLHIWLTLSTGSKEYFFICLSELLWQLF